ncbi:MAG TPA: hypothetical protein VLG50_02320 [Candidatus Saccharimonadales bacterium]|nr:hypothetical protein [Candidatus Saccharimonadales bacterium]
MKKQISLLFLCNFFVTGLVQAPFDGEAPKFDYGEYHEPTQADIEEHERQQREAQEVARQKEIERQQQEREELARKAELDAIATRNRIIKQQEEEALQAAARAREPEMYEKAKTFDYSFDDEEHEEQGVARSTTPTVSASVFKRIVQPQAPKPALDEGIAIDADFAEKMSADDINKINEKYKKLNDTQREVFVKNINRLVKDHDSTLLDVSDIITFAYDDAEKSKSTWTFKSLKNRFSRIWTRFTKAEDDYFDLVLKQAKDGDLDSKELLTSREWFKEEAKKDLKQLNLTEKRKFLKSIQDKANKIVQKITKSYIQTPEEAEQSNPAQSRLKSKQQTEFTKQFKKSCAELIQTLTDTMLDKVKGQKILTVWDRENYNLILDIVELDKESFNLKDPMLDQVNTVISSLSEKPKHSLTIPEFKTQVALDMIDFYLSPYNVSHRSADMRSAIEAVPKNIKNPDDILKNIIERVQKNCKSLADEIPEYRDAFNKQISDIVTKRFNEYRAIHGSLD